MLPEMNNNEEYLHAVQTRDKARQHSSCHDCSTAVIVGDSLQIIEKP